MKDYPKKKIKEKMDRIKKLAEWFAKNYYDKWLCDLKSHERTAVYICAMQQVLAEDGYEP